MQRGDFLMEDLTNVEKIIENIGVNSNIAEELYNLIQNL